MPIDIDFAKEQLEEVLAPYGYFIGSKENKLRFEFVTLGILALTVIGWGIGQYAKVFIGERAKMDAKRFFQDKEMDEKALQQKIDELLIELRSIKSYVDSERLQRFELMEQELTAYFVSIGLSERAAQQASNEVKPVLESQVRQLIEGK